MERACSAILSLFVLCLLVQANFGQFDSDDLAEYATLNDTEAWILCETKFPGHKKVLNESIFAPGKCRATCKFSDGITNPVIATEPDDTSCPASNTTKGVCTKGYCLDRNDPFSACNALDDVRGNVIRAGTKFADPDQCTAVCAEQGWSPTKNVNNGQPCAQHTDGKHFCYAGKCIIDTDEDIEATKVCDSLPDIQGNVDKLGNAFADPDKCQALCMVLGFKETKSVNEGQPCASHKDATHFCHKGTCIVISQDDIDATKACNDLAEIKGNVDRIGSKFADKDQCRAHCSVYGSAQDWNVNEGKPCQTDKAHVCHLGKCAASLF